MVRMGDAVDLNSWDMGSRAGVDLNLGYDGPDNSYVTSHNTMEGLTDYVTTTERDLLGRTRTVYLQYHPDEAELAFNEVHRRNQEVGFGGWEDEEDVEDNPRLTSTTMFDHIWYGSNYNIDRMHNWIVPDSEAHHPNAHGGWVEPAQYDNLPPPRSSRIRLSLPLLALLSAIPAMVLNQAWKRRQVPPWYQDSLDLEMFNPGKDGFVTHYNIGRSEMDREEYQFYWRMRAFQQANREWEVDEL